MTFDKGRGKIKTQNRKYRVYSIKKLDAERRVGASSLRKENFRLFVTI